MATAGGDAACGVAAADGMVGSSLGSTTVGAREQDLVVAGEPGTAISAGAMGSNVFGSVATGVGGALGVMSGQSSSVQVR